jgi:hypothetical protein
MWNWKVPDDQSEIVREVPPAARTIPKPVPAAVVSAPDLFLSGFHRKIKELPGAEDYETIAELATRLFSTVQ